MNTIKNWNNFLVNEEVMSAQDTQSSRDWDEAEKNKGFLKITFKEEGNENPLWMTINLYKGSETQVSNGAKMVKVTNTNSKKLQDADVVYLTNYPTLVGQQFSVGDGSKLLGKFTLVKTEKVQATAPARKLAPAQKQGQVVGENMNIIKNWNEFLNEKKETTEEVQSEVQKEVKKKLGTDTAEASEKPMKTNYREHYVKFFKNKLAKHGAKNLSELGDKRSAFFKEIKSEWAKYKKNH